MGSDDFMGIENYKYTDQIKTPYQMGMNSKGTFGQMKKNISSLNGYMQVLNEGGGPASKVQGGLGNRYFIDTDSDCVDANGTEHKRSIYIDNVPTTRGKLKSVFGKRVGLIPGVMNNVTNISPMKMAKAFIPGKMKRCDPVKLSTIDKWGNTGGRETRHVTRDDIEDIDECWFVGKRQNPITKRTCGKDGFSTISQSTTHINHSIGLEGSEYDSTDSTDSYGTLYDSTESTVSLDSIESLYTILLGGVGLYAIHQLIARG